MTLCSLSQSKYAWSIETDVVSFVVNSRELPSSWMIAPDTEESEIVTVVSGSILPLSTAVENWL